uniref:ABC transporter ATP-binding protein n=1 Tax=Desulfosarcina cetonica TaxID=90730 RepID=UPI000A630594
MILLEDVNRIFQVGGQPVHALAHVNLEITQGEYLSIMGPSGSGKSTLLNILGLLDRPDSGHYLLDDKDTTTLGDDQQARLRHFRIGFIFQFFHLVPRLTAADNVALPLVLAGMPVRERKDRVAAALQ